MQSSLDKNCLACICHAISDCNTNAGCISDSCGPFQITEAYWIDAGKPAPGAESSYVSPDQQGQGIAFYK